MQLKKLDPRLRRYAAEAELKSFDDETALDTFPSAPASLESTSAVSPPLGEVRRVLVELQADQPPAAFADFHWVHVAGKIYSVSLPMNRLVELHAHPSVETVEAGRRWFPMLETSLAETRANTVHQGSTGVPGRTGAGVLVGIIDYGMDFTLDDFRKADGTTRLAFLWDQRLDARPGESAPDDFAYGVEYGADQIDEALNASDPFSVVRHRPDAASHGTHVAGIAAGNGRSHDSDFAQGAHLGAAPEATLIFVQPDTRDGSGTFTDSSHVVDAVAYIMGKADALDMPCVINMSLGQNGGSHDGESLVERAIDRLLEPLGRAFVSAAGNEHVWHGHAAGNIKTGESRELRWKTGGGMPLPDGTITQTGTDRTSSELEIWYSSVDRFAVTLTAPDGTQYGPVTPGKSLLQDEVFIDSERFSSLNGQARIYMQLDAPFGLGMLRSGVWTLKLEALEGENGRFDAWIERDLRDRDNNYADQSFFQGGDFDPVRTLGTPATTRRAIAVANYSHYSLSPAASSSRGPTRDNRNKPEVAAPGTNIVASCAQGGRNNGNGGVHPMRVLKSGTSMAAPHVAGIVALLFQEARSLSAPQIANILMATSDNPDGIPGFDVAWGFGRVNAARALRLLRDPDQPGRTDAVI